MNLALVVKYLYPDIKLGSVDDDGADCAISVENGVPTIVVWRYAQPIPTQAELDAAALPAQAAQDAADAEAAVDRQNRLDMKNKIIDFRTDMDSIVTSQQVYIDTPATNNVGRDAHLNQIAKDLKQLARDFKQLANVVKGLA